MKKIKPKKFMYIQDGGTYTNEVLVAVDVTVEDILRFTKGLNFSEDFPRRLRATFENKDIKDAAGRTLFDQGRSILYLCHWENTWEDYETLLHECWHLVHHTLVVNKHMGMEDEAQAYQLEYWFHNIRERLDAHYGKAKRANFYKRSC